MGHLEVGDWDKKGGAYLRNLEGISTNGESVRGELPNRLLIIGTADGVDGRIDLPGDSYDNEVGLEVGTH